MTNKIKQYELWHHTITAIGVIGIAIAYLMIIALNNIMYEGNISWDFMIYCTMCGAPFVIVEGIFCQEMVKFCNRKAWGHKYEKWVFTSQLLLNILTAIGFTIIAFMIFDPHDHETFTELANEMYFNISIVADAMVATVILLLAKYVDQLDYSKLRDKQLEEQELLITQMRYHQLKAQVNPHFLFNSLNVLASLINIDQGKAVKFTKELASIYRYFLTNDNKNELSSLKEELNFASQYSNIIQIRYDEGLTVHLPQITDPVTAALRIIPTSVQLLIENACKHNIASAERPLTIDVYLDNNNVIVTNNINPRPRPADSTGLGLSGLVSKYEIITKRKIEIIKTDEKFTVKVPLLSAAEAQNIFSQQ